DSSLGRRPFLYADQRLPRLTVENVELSLLGRHDDRRHRTVGSGDQLHPNQITQWKRQAIENLAKAFDDKAADAQVGREAEVTKLHAKIGQLVVERDFLAKAFDR